MSHLFQMPLRGAGSSEVEALSSYIYRLAIAHGVSAWQLLAYARSWYGTEVPRGAQLLAALRKSPDLPIVVRPNELTKTIVDMLARATGNRTLSCSTFLALKDALDRSVGTFSKTLRWCRGCVADFIAADDPGYFKLAWHLVDVTHCPVHRLPLVDRCAKCQRPQRGTRRFDNCISCFSCGCPLSEGTPQRSRPSWSHEGDDLIQLVAAIGVDSTLSFPNNGVREVLSKLFDNAWEHEQELKFYSIMPRDECLALISGDIPISLTMARKISFRLGIPLVDLLSGTIHDSAPGILNVEWTATLPSQMRPKTRLKRKERDVLLERLNNSLNSAFAEHPPSLKALARDLGVSVGCLHYHFPQLAKEVIQRHKQWRIAEAERKARQARAAALAFFTSERYAHLPKSKKHALRVLMRETGLPKNLLRREILTAVEAIGVARPPAIKSERAQFTGG